MAKAVSTERRRQVYANANGICEYCRCQEELCPDPFAVEHIFPRSRGGTDALDNLALSCDGCNDHKSTKVNGVDPIDKTVVPLFHPRRQQWVEHFEWSTDFTLVLGLTETGRATVDVLKLNRPGVVKLRRALRKSRLHPP